ncbi:MAG: tetratricopeptide repeat protein [Hyphomonadaceae bacterium]
MARIALNTGDAEQARAKFSTWPLRREANDPEIAEVRTALELAANAPADSETAALRSKVDANPHRLPSALRFGRALSAGGDLEAASEHLLAIIARTAIGTKARRATQLLKIFEAAGPTSDVTKQGRRRSCRRYCSHECIRLSIKPDLRRPLPCFPQARSCFRADTLAQHFRTRYLNMIDDALGGERLINAWSSQRSAKKAKPCPISPTLALLGASPRFSELMMAAI